MISLGKETFLLGKENDEGFSENPDSLKGRKVESGRTNLMVTVFCFVLFSGR